METFIDFVLAWVDSYLSTNVVCLEKGKRTSESIFWKGWLQSETQDPSDTPSLARGKALGMTV